MLVLQAFVLHFRTFHTCLSQNKQPYAAPSLTYRSCTFGRGARQWRCTNAQKIYIPLDGIKVGHFLITIQKSFKPIINQSWI